LTQREQETVKLLLQGLTSKEIAVRMEISANTVKAFVRLVMIKMGVSTRSGIAGKFVPPEP
jgi:DNA-binding CsgD family transcriptional regulator